MGNRLVRTGYSWRFVFHAPRFKFLYFNDSYTSKVGVHQSCRVFSFLLFSLIIIGPPFETELLLMGDNPVGSNKVPKDRSIADYSVDRARTVPLQGPELVTKNQLVGIRPGAEKSFTIMRHIYRFEGGKLECIHYDLFSPLLREDITDLICWDLNDADRFLVEIKQLLTGPKKRPAAEIWSIASLPLTIKLSLISDGNNLNQNT